MSEHPRRILMRFNEMINAAELYDEDDPIRPVLQCLETNDEEVVFMRELVRRYNAHVESLDLVRVAVAAAKLAPHVDIEEQCEHLVDRLTKGDV